MHQLRSHTPLKDNPGAKFPQEPRVYEMNTSSAVKIRPAHREEAVFSFTEYSSTNKKKTAAQESQNRSPHQHLRNDPRYIRYLELRESI
jgi:hypothetical protein